MPLEEVRCVRATMRWRQALGGVHELQMFQFQKYNASTGRCAAACLLLIGTAAGRFPVRTAPDYAQVWGMPTRMRSRTVTVCSTSAGCIVNRFFE